MTETRLGFEACETCRHLARQARQSGEDVTARRSTEVLFGLHVLTEHPEAPVPEPVPETCATCSELLAHLPVDDSGGCITTDDVVMQHRASHLLHLVPVVPPSLWRPATES
ncbi:hypothetical protein [Streptomyces mayteni]